MKAFRLVIIITILFLAITVQAYQSQQQELVKYGKGEIYVRLYTNYFCEACYKLEAEIEPLLKGLVEKNLITLSFIDVPSFPVSSMYARYFLYSVATDKNKDIDYAFKVRKILFEASKQGVVRQEAVEGVLLKNNIKFKHYEFLPEMNLMKYIREDKIQYTPTCVVEIKGKKEQYVGKKEIFKALQKIEVGETI